MKYGNAVLLVDWENLVGAILERGKVVERSQVDDLWEFASRRSGEGLHHAHMAAARFDPTISAAMREHLIAEEIVGSTKEQADILLTVLAMDHLYAGVDQFFLVTGDQDFIELIKRLHRDGRKVTVVYGDPRRLSGELERVLRTPGLESLDIADITALRDRGSGTGSRALIGLLELQRRGHFLGGKERGERTSLLAQWGVLDNDDQNQYWSLIGTMAEKTTRPDAASPGPNNEWHPRPAMRTYLKVGPEQLTDIIAVDHVVRLVASRPRGLTIGRLRSGPLEADDGTGLDRALDALLACGLVRRGADGTYSLVGAPLQLGYLEQLWRVYAAVTAECYRLGTASFPFGKLEPLLNRRGIGQGKEQRSAGRIREAVNYAKAAGVIDAVAIDGSRHVTAPDSVLSRPFENAYHWLYRTFASGGNAVAVLESDVFGAMEVRDRSQSVQLFGHEPRDRHRVLRILAQSQLVVLRDGHVTFTRSGWGDAGLALGR